MIAAQLAELIGAEQVSAERAKCGGATLLVEALAE